MHKYIIFFLFPILIFSKPIATLPMGKAYPKPLIFLDPGHGGAALGAVIKKPYIEEKRFCLQTALKTKKYLEKMGYKVSISRTKDYFVPLSKRTEMANKANAGVFVCIHYNSCNSPEVHGMEVFYNEKNNKKSVFSKRLADTLLSKSVQNTKAASRGVKKGGFYVIRETKMPAVLIEAGFLSNSLERNKIKQTKYLEKIAKGIAEGIDSFVKNKE